MIGCKVVASIINAGRKLGVKSKNEDTIGWILKGLANIISFEKISPNNSIFSTLFKY